MSSTLESKTGIGVFIFLVVLIFTSFTKVRKSHDINARTNSEMQFEK